MRLGIPEINQHTVAHIPRDIPAKTLDRLGDAAVIGADDSAQILRIEPRRQRGRADHIAEHHGQLPAFGTGWCRSIAGRRCPGGGRLSIERGNGIEELAAMASEHHAEILEIFRCQLRQRFPIDLVIAEGRHITRKAQTL